MAKPMAKMPSIPDRWQRDFPLTRLTTWRIGGTAAFLSYPRDGSELQADCEAAGALGIPVFALGAGSNLLFPDAGYPGLLVRLPSGPVTDSHGAPLAHAPATDDPVTALVRCPSGLPLPRLVRRLARQGWAGLEWAEGIPGTVGGAIVNNAGAFGGQMADALVGVEMIAPPEPPRAGDAGELGLAYRASKLKNLEPTRIFLLAGIFRLSPGRPEALAARMAEIRARRRRNAPREPSCGSVFRNPAGQAAGNLIEQAGLSGMRIGDAQVSTRHANYIVNRGQATAREVIDLIRIVRERVRSTSDIALELEVQPVGFPERPFDL